MVSDEDDSDTDIFDVIQASSEAFRRARLSIVTCVKVDCSPSRATKIDTCLNNLDAIVARSALVRPFCRGTHVLYAQRRRGYLGHCRYESNREEGLLGVRRG